MHNYSPLLWKNHLFQYVGNSSESVILGDETFRRSVGIQADVSDKNKVKHYYASDSDDEDVKRVKADAQGNSVMEKSKKLKKVKDDTSDAEEGDKESKKFSRKAKKDTSDEEFMEFTWL